MPQSLSKVNLHLVFSTKDRAPFIHTKIEKRVHSYLAVTCNEIGCPAYEIGGMDDHVHLLIAQSRTITISKLVESIKVSSSSWIKSIGDEYKKFSWQRGYGVFCVDEATFDAVKQYIATQNEHHKSRGFKEEYLLLLKRYQVAYDPEYVWD